MKEKKEIDLTPGAKRFLEFVDKEGGPSEVARKIDKHPQFIYNVQIGKAKPSFDTWELLHRAYPGKIDLNYLVLGIKPKPMVSDSAMQELSDLRGRVSTLESLVDRLEKKNAHLMERNERLTDMLLDRAGMGIGQQGFLLAASEPPVVYERNEIEGFRTQRHRRPVASRYADVALYAYAHG